MRMDFAPRGVIEFDGVDICSRNFSGEATEWNNQGSRNFSLKIKDSEAIDALINDVNEYGVGFNVKVQPPKEAGDDETGYLKVNVRFNDRGPNILVISGNNRTVLNERTVDTLDGIDIAHVKLSITPYDSIGRDGKPHRTAWLRSMIVTQDLDNVGREISELMSNYDDEVPFN